MLADKIIALSERRPPDVVIGEGEPYMKRWWVIPRNRFLNIYLHEFLRSDDDRALHDHPWWNCSILLRGTYVEHTERRMKARRSPLRARSLRAWDLRIIVGTKSNTRRQGEIVFRGAKHAHRIELTAGPCWTLFITGPRFRVWGFHCPRGWRPWTEFCSTTSDGRNAGGIGKGCD